MSAKLVIDKSLNNSTSSSATMETNSAKTKFDEDKVLDLELILYLVQ